ncbi:hypothetical protein C8F01DRAFT_1099228 [Mycena amicta]|nr:hypothetical protein C8F01DRAFT_1099228 [Mycena amicta]
MEIKLEVASSAKITIEIASQLSANLKRHHLHLRVGQQVRFSLRGLESMRIGPGQDNSVLRYSAGIVLEILASDINQGRSVDTFTDSEPTLTAEDEWFYSPRSDRTKTNGSTVAFPRPLAQLQQRTSPVSNRSSLFMDLAPIPRESRPVSTSSVTSDQVRFPATTSSISSARYIQPSDRILAPRATNLRLNHTPNAHITTPSLLSNVTIGCGSFQCLVHLLDKWDSQHACSLYITDYSVVSGARNFSASRWCPPRVGDRVLQVELRGNAHRMGESLATDSIYLIQQVSLKYSKFGNIEGLKNVAGGITKVEQDHPLYREGVAALLKRKKDLGL